MSRLNYLFRLLFLSVFSIFLILMIFSPAAYAHVRSDPITVTSESDSMHFPDSIDFQMSAVDSSSPITEAIIYIAYDAGPDTYPTLHPISISKPARSITVSWQENTSGNNFLMPGTPVQYYWVIQDSSGYQHTQATQYFTIIDTRFSWQNLSQGMLHVYWYTRSQAFGQLLLQDAVNSLNHISSNLGGGLLHPINLWVYASEGDFHGALPPGSYEWVGGEAVPPLNEAFISALDSQDPTLVRDMPHELAHLVFHQLIAQGQAVPTWFDEGLAVYNQFYHEPEMEARFQEALMTHSLLRLADITLNFPADAGQAYLAYAESWQLITYMYKTFGLAKMVRLIGNMNDPAIDFDSDLQRVLGENTLYLENQWRLSLGQPGVLSPDQITPTPRSSSPVNGGQRPAASDGTIPILTTIGVLLIVFPLMGIVAIIVYQRRKQGTGELWLQDYATLDRKVDGNGTQNAHKPAGQVPAQEPFQGFREDVNLPQKQAPQE